jgi:hypothetical protein
MNVSTLTTAELVAVYNKFAPVPVKKFSDRKTAERRVAPYLAKIDTASVYGHSEHGLTTCPVCDTHLSNGISRHGDDVNGKPLRHTSGFMFECLACGAGFGEKVRTSKGGSATGKRPEMARSMELHREIECVDTGAVYKNGFAVKKAGLITSSDCNKLTRVLYTAAKAGDRTKTVELRGLTFRLHLS